MKNTIKMLGIIAMMAIVVFTMAACKGKNSGSDASSSAAAAAANAAAPAASTGLGSNSVDSFIADYEKFINDYTAAMQKMLAGDLSAAADLEKYVPIFESWQKRLENYTESDFTPAQTRKIEELTNKLTQSMGL